MAFGSRIFAVLLATLGLASAAVAADNHVIAYFQLGTKDTNAYSFALYEGKFYVNTGREGEIIYDLTTKSVLFKVEGKWVDLEEIAKKIPTGGTNTKALEAALAKAREMVPDLIAKSNIPMDAKRKVAQDLLKRFGMKWKSVPVRTRNTGQTATEYNVPLQLYLGDRMNVAEFFYYVPTNEDFAPAVKIAAAYLELQDRILTLIKGPYSGDSTDVLDLYQVVKLAGQMPAKVQNLDTRVTYMLMDCPFLGWQPTFGNKMPTSECEPVIWKKEKK
ncbi:MAG: hypothetical protein QNJ44_10135 [Rhodobacter sp.]|nr:hypothetical protein [Rhodobacter sp.]